MNMERWFDSMKDKAAMEAVRSASDYIGEDGFMHCGVCGQRKELDVSLMGRKRIVPCLCRCEVERKRLIEEQMRREEAARNVSHLKSVGLTDRRFHEWRFDRDNGKNPKMSYAYEYVERWPEMKEKNIGLLITGPVGTGKSFLAGCIANALLEQEIPVMMTNFPRIFNELTNYGADKKRIIDALAGYPLLILDDLGIERNSEFALEQVYSVIDRRYCCRKPLIVTTNLTTEEMEHADLEHQRIYSRIFEMCIPVSCIGENIRKQEEKAKQICFLGEERYYQLMEAKKKNGRK